MTTLVSWNVNGIRSITQKGFFEAIALLQPDILCLQETKVHTRDLDRAAPSLPGYVSYWHSAERAGYSGVALYSRAMPLSIRQGMGSLPDPEGRVLTAEYEEAFVVNLYAPNSQTYYVRLPFRLAWEAHMRSYLAALQTQKPLIVCGDLNVAPTDLDIGIDRTVGFPGCSPEEQQNFAELLQLGLIDSFRELHPATRAYSWWSYTQDARAWNQGLRFDHILLSTSLRPSLHSSETYREILGSDHGPVAVKLTLPLRGTTSAQEKITPSGQLGFL